MAMARHERRLRFDVCEARVVLSSGLPASTIAAVAGTVSAPNAVAEVSVPISPQNLGGRRSVFVTESVQPAAGSSLAPTIVGARGPSGQPLFVRPGAPFRPPVRTSALAFVRVDQPGPVTFDISGSNGTTGAFTVGVALPGNLSGTGQVTVSDLGKFAKSYNTLYNDALYNTSADANRNGHVGQTDGMYVLRNLTPLTRKHPLELSLSLAPGEAATGQVPLNSGGTTYKQDVTIVGKTTPGSLVLSDTGLGDYSFNGNATYADSQGNFTYKVHLTSGLNNYEFHVIDPYGQQTIRAYPILWIPFAAKGSTLH
jgi:hypothetical protein